ncbi:PREDICTED: NADH dehydrogenase [ubiquinone] 1 alpha subcomplex subunit 9, mitochondrial-like [Amphimedon queenslandica]|uniref:NADH dehydrogenase [ubiquinone] 1 alpha subcomplex subunit 9, mitochondrial n=1 Tax=Amphimedon queenslandica TaxID=400682 RepID=A0A1X7TME2_AMPQE|nr:PREDICTED: NADH dehydrogenase [ubiquinone] 1 alpha subcomplex subunit 9, mitochondrial-like [Amphimedon queenslandica]|eukprot:XP_003390219.1 PREDICTED: NADH dehydrogenase [ubiquinone] 1 alpha subcomplex subunit 9, mitochondrial-like [Amphimedon queenslandica]
MATILRSQRSLKIAPRTSCIIELTKKSISSDVKRGTGGRSSFSGTVATVFGCTGFCGRYIVNRLGQVGSQIVAPYRGDEHDYRHLRPMGDLGQILFRSFNLRDPESVTKTLEYSNVVVNAIGRDYETRNFKFDDVHVQGSRVIAEAAKKAGVKRLIHFSALGASKDSPSKFLQSKAAGEEAVREVFPDATIIRPAAIYGREDRYFNLCAKFKVFPLGRVPLMNYGHGIYKYPVSVVDVAKAVVQIIADQGTAGTTYELVGPKQYLLLDLVDYLFRVIHRPFRPINLPRFVFRMTAWGLEQSPFIPYLTRDVLTRMYLSEEPSGDLPGLEDLGITPITVEEAALFILRRYRGFFDFGKSVDEIEPEAK